MGEAAPRPWQVQAMEAREKEKMLASILEKLRGLSMAGKDSSSGLSEAEREAARAKAKEEIAVLMPQAFRLSSEIKTPDYSGMTEDERAAEAERLRQEALEEAERLKLEGDLFNGLAKERRARILDFDPKQDGVYYNRLHSVNFSAFNLDEESPIGPRRFTFETYEKGKAPPTCMAINILSVKIACSDVGFPIQVYGSVIARDSTDLKCLYIFRRDRDHCQLINSEDEPLILTGPNRGLALLDYNYVETDLKIKDHQGKDRELSKGLLQIRGIRTMKCDVETKSIATRLSTVDVMYAVVPHAVEGSIEIRVIRGPFDGTITAYTTSFPERIVVYDSKVAGTMVRGLSELLRHAVSVYVKDKLIIDAKTSAGESKNLNFTPAVNGVKNVVITLGATKMRVMVSWSIMDP